MIRALCNVRRLILACRLMDYIAIMLFEELCCL
jgi:hypothetical protein